MCVACVSGCICVSLYGICGGSEEEGWGEVCVSLSVGVYA